MRSVPAAGPPPSRPDRWRSLRIALPGACGGRDVPTELHGIVAPVGTYAPRRRGWRGFRFERNDSRRWRVRERSSQRRWASWMLNVPSPIEPSFERISSGRTAPRCSPATTPPPPHPTNPPLLLLLLSHALIPTPNPFILSYLGLVSPVFSLLRFVSPFHVGMVLRLISRPLMEN